MPEASEAVRAIGVTLRNHALKPPSNEREPYRHPMQPLFGRCGLYLMLVRGWAMVGITGIIIRSAAGNIGLFAVIRRAVPGVHLMAQEQRKPDQERDSDDQRRCQRF
jgi:hypothetical protein